MPSAHLLLASLLQFQTLVAPEPPAAEEPPVATAERATEAAERAAQAAERAAQAAERAAEASVRLAEALERLAAHQPPASAPAASSPPEEPSSKEEVTNPWKATVGLGFISLTGNASTLTLNGLVLVERKWADWIFASKAFGVYGRSRPPETQAQQEETQVVALNAGLNLRLDRRFSGLLSGYLLSGTEMDHVRSVELRGYGEGGVSLLWWDAKGQDERVSTLRTDLAFRFMRELRFQYYPERLNLPDVDLASPRFAVSFRYGITKDILFQEDLEVLPNVLGSSRLLVNNTAKLTARLTDSLAMGASFLVQHDSAPAEGKVPTDTSLSVTVELAL